MLFFTAILSVSVVNSALAEVLLLGLGGIENSTNNFYNYRDNMDIVQIDHDLSSYGSYCTPLPDFPLSGYRAAGGVVNGRIVECGGLLEAYPRQKCYASDPMGWQPIGDLTFPREYHAAATLPNGDLWITGGRIPNTESCQHTTDIVTSNMEVIRGPDMPDARCNHCVARLNSTSMMLVGGYFEDVHRVDLFNAETQEWSSFATYTRHEHAFPACVTFTDTDGKDKVMVIGNGYWYEPAKAEIYDGVSWEVLEDLPSDVAGMQYPKAVFYKEKIIVTGGSFAWEPVLTSWEFDINTRTWAPGFQMNPPIWGHISFVVPDSFCVQ